MGDSGPSRLSAPRRLLHCCAAAVFPRNKVEHAEDDERLCDEGRRRERTNNSINNKNEKRRTSVKRNATMSAVRNEGEAKHGDDDSPPHFYCAHHVTRAALAAQLVLEMYCGDWTYVHVPVHVYTYVYSSIAI